MYLHSLIAISQDVVSVIREVVEKFKLKYKDIAAWDLPQRKISKEIIEW